MATNGLVLIKPSSTAVTGASATATINTGGSVTFDLCETLSLNGVFSSTYDNYIIDMRMVGSNSGSNFSMRMRVSGTDNTTSNSYVGQYLNAGSTTVSGSRSTSTSTSWGLADSSLRSGCNVFMYGPNLAQPTAGRSVTVSAFNNAAIEDWAWTHNQSTAYDGFTLFQASSRTMSGLVKVYGLVK